MPGCRSAAYEYREPAKPASPQGRAFPWSAHLLSAAIGGALRALSVAGAFPAAGACCLQILSFLALRLVPTAPCHGQRPAVTTPNRTVLRFSQVPSTKPDHAPYLRRACSL